MKMEPYGVKATERNKDFSVIFCTMRLKIVNDDLRETEEA